MKQIDTIMSQMTGAPVLKELANALREYSTEFPEEEKKYYEAASKLRDTPFPRFLLRHAHSGACGQSLLSAPVSIHAWSDPSSILPPPTVF